MRFLFLLAFCTAGPALAESVIATRGIRAQTILSAMDMALVDAEIPGALTDLSAAIGQETRTTLYPGRAIRESDLGAPTIIERNQIIPLTYSAGGLRIETDGRALARGGAGDMIRVMNISSRNTVSGRVIADGTVQVGQTP
mgnify:FL=1